MLKHVQISPMRSRSRSTSNSCASSLCGSPEPPPSEQHRSSSRASSYSSLSESVPQTTLKVYTDCLHQDIKYKTLVVSFETTCRDVVGQVLRRCKMRHRDPKLFYLSMDVTVRPSAVQTTLTLDAEARPALLQACHPKGDSKFSLQTKTGGLVRVRTSVLQPMSQYKSLMISEATTCDELLSLLLSSFNMNEQVEQFFLYEVCPNQEYQRKLHPDDLPLQVQSKRHQRGEICHFLVRKNPNYLQRNSLLLPAIAETTSYQLITDVNLSTMSLPVMAVAGSRRRATICASTLKKPQSLSNTVSSPGDDSSLAGSPTYENVNVTENLKMARKSLLLNFDSVREKSSCPKCGSSITLFCEHCDAIDSNNNAVSPDQSQPNIVETYNYRVQRNQQRHSIDTGRTFASLATASSYCPVYNIREIRSPTTTTTHSFSAFGVDKCLMNMDHLDQIYAFDLINQSDAIDRSNQHQRHHQQQQSQPAHKINGSRRNSLVITEAVNTNPKQGVGNFVYI